ncbi:hypothetical protein SAMN05216299_12818 [Nitrosospira sp. Nsp14]|nr:hypothetical protein SAMN05216299_12818 [Nitrosospira sp. Nsp14]
MTSVYELNASQYQERNFVKQVMEAESELNGTSCAQNVCSHPVVEVRATH